MVWFEIKFKILNLFLSCLNFTYVSEDFLSNESVWCGLNEIFYELTFYCIASIVARSEVLLQFYDYDLEYTIILVILEWFLSGFV